MKVLNFKQSVLTAGVVTALGLSGTAMAASSGDASISGGSQITNIATASYSVDGTAQPTVESNEVIVNINEVGSFKLVATQGASTTDDINEDQFIEPGGTVNFVNELTNTGNVDDTYTITLSDTSTNLIPGVTDDFAYTDETTTPITITVLDAAGNPVANNPSGIAYPKTITSGGQIALAPGHKVQMSYDVTPETYSDAGDSGLMTLSAISTYITNNPTAGAKATLVNENEGIITNPIFKIVKTAASPNVDLATATTIDYTIVVTNEDVTNSADATNITIADTIPAGLQLNTSSIVVTAGDTTTSTTASTANELVVSGLDLAKGEVATITFTTNIVDKATLSSEGSVTNHANVYDAYDDTVDPKANPDIVDSTDETTDGNTNGVDDSTDDVAGGTGGDSPAVVGFTDRQLTMTTDNSIELAPTDTHTVTHIITNNGNQVEGDAAGELVLTITEGTPDGEVQPTGEITITIKDALGNVIAQQTYPDGTTSIDFATVTNDGGVPVGIPVGGTAEVTYTEASNNNYNSSTQEPITPSDTTTLTLTPKGDGAPTPISNTDTYNVEDMDLLKEQALDTACDGTADDTFSTAPVTAKPGECVIYRITASNDFTSKSLSNVIISDAKSNWENDATYVVNSAKDSANGTVIEPGTAVQSSAMTIPAGSSASLTFRIQINTAQ